MIKTPNLLSLSSAHSLLLERIHHRCFEQSWSCDFFQKTLSAKTLCPAFGWVAFGDTQPFGFLLARHLVEEIEILTFAVLPEFQNQGIGTHLIKKLQQETTNPLYLEVAVDNKAALNLYNKVGFKIAGKRPRYYSHQDGRTTDAFLMHYP